MWFTITVDLQTNGIEESTEIDPSLHGYLIFNKDDKVRTAFSTTGYPSRKK